MLQFQDLVIAVRSRGMAGACKNAAHSVRLLRMGIELVIRDSTSWLARLQRPSRPTNGSSSTRSGADFGVSLSPIADSAKRRISETQSLRRMNRCAVSQLTLAWGDRHAKRPVRTPSPSC